MPIRTTGKQIKDFYNDGAFWPRDGCVTLEEELVSVNGIETDDLDTSQLKDDDVVILIGGSVDLGFREGRLPLLTYFRRWVKTQNTITIIVEADASIAEAVRLAIKRAGGVTK